MPTSPIKHVFVLMLENHSFDCMFALSGIPGICAATSANSNSFAGKTYSFGPGAPQAMPTDPGHEFYDVFQQLTGIVGPYQNGATYPPVNNSGFAANYATSSSEGPPAPPTAGEVEYIMSGFTSPTDLPVMNALATQFVLCDKWFSSLPGPTWPNRFFVHGASSAGLDHSPTDSEMVAWYEFGGGFQYPNRSIYNRMADAGVPYRLYIDKSGAYEGSLAQVASLADISSVFDVNDLADFSGDLSDGYGYGYTFIEPNYGYVSSTYTGGSSQHPMDCAASGERLIKTVYEAIRNSPVWDSSLLIITYDEHGGFYDQCKPGPVVAPGDTTLPNPNSWYGFTFEQLGVRVPTILVSPWVAAGAVDSTAYDHSSVLATVESLFGLQPLTKRDAAAADVLANVTTTCRTDCPVSLPNPLSDCPQPTATDAELAAIAAQPLPPAGNLRGFLGVALKTKLELAGGTPAARATALAEFRSLQTRGHAKAYLESAVAGAEAARAAGRSAAPGR